MEQYRCSRCQAEFSTAEQLNRHMKQHTSPAEQGSEWTPGAFRLVDQTERSRGERSSMDYGCPRCGAEFSTREELDRHGRAQHLMD
jgi:DNA-directed RNA polymerase subunit RPC12/RpoP